MSSANGGKATMTQPWEKPLLFCLDTPTCSRASSKANASGTPEVLVLVFKRQESSRNEQDCEHRLLMHPSIPELVQVATRHIREEYPFPDSAERAVTALEDLLRMDREARLVGDLPTVCATLTEVLQQATGDLHLRVIHHPAGAPDPEDEEAYTRHWTGDAARTAGGIQSVRRLLEDNIAVVQIGPFLGLPEYAGTWQAAAMSLCQGAAAAILDLRGCVGGTPESAALVCSYLFGPEPVHLSDVLSREGTHQYWTQPMLPGPRLGSAVPIIVAVSSTTFSGGEEIAFNLQELGRARVFGEHTRGGANPRVGIRIHRHVELALPVASPRSPRTGRNWEGVGVTPDVSVAAEKALDVAVTELHDLLVSGVSGT